MVMRVIIIVMSVPVIRAPMIISVIIIERIPVVTVPQQTVTMIIRDLIVLGGFVVIVYDHLPC
jgi:hypothetical protein